MALSSGSYTFENLELNTEVMNQEFELPISIISGELYNLKFEIPWYKLFTTATVKIEMIGKLIILLL